MTTLPSSSASLAPAAASTTADNMSTATATIMESCFMQANPCLYTHVHALQHRKDEYLLTVKQLIEKGLVSSTTQAIKARAIAALHIAREHAALWELVQHCELVEIVKALTMLDRPRKLRQLRRKVLLIETKHPHVLVVEEVQESTAEASMENGLGRRQYRRQYRRQRHRRPSQITVTTATMTTAPSSDDDNEDRQNHHQAVVRRRLRQKGLRRLRQEIKDLEANGDHMHAVTTNNNNSHALAHADTATHELIESSSVSGALSHMIRKWAKSHLKSDFLEFVVLTMPVTLWKQLSDLVHFRPDDFALPYFLGFVHGGPLPEGSLVKDMRAFLDSPWEARTTAFCNLVERHPQVYLNYSYLRTQTEVMKSHAVILEMLAQNIPLDTAIWYLEELAALSKKDVVPNIVARRIQNEDFLSSSSLLTSKVTTLGKLVERIMTFQEHKWHDLVNALLPVAEQKLSALKEEWSTPTSSDPQHHQQPPRTVVFGDASASMQTAVKAATILASMISVCWDGELSFFQTGLVPSPHPRPTNLREILEVCQKVRANASTSLAAALWPYYAEKRKLDRIFMVTDEYENTPCQNYMFAKLLQLYKNEVCDTVEFVLIGVGTGYAPFTKSLADCGITYKRLEIDNRLPDLSKFDALLGQLAMASSDRTTAMSTAPAVATSGNSNDDFEML